MALHKLVGKDGVDANLAARIALLDAQIQPRGTPAQAFAQAEQAVPELIKHGERILSTCTSCAEAHSFSRRSRDRLAREPHRGRPAVDGLAAKRYDDLEKSKRLNAIDKLRLGQLQALQKGKIHQVGASAVCNILDLRTVAPAVRGNDLPHVVLRTRRATLHKSRQNLPQIGSACARTTFQSQRFYSGHQCADAGTQFARMLQRHSMAVCGQEPIAAHRDDVFV